MQGHCAFADRRHGFHLLIRQHYAAIGADSLKVVACKLFELEQRRVAPVFSPR